jgi:hypothetical protein
VRTKVGKGVAMLMPGVAIVAAQSSAESVRGTLSVSATVLGCSVAADRRTGPGAKVNCPPGMGWVVADAGARATPDANDDPGARGEGGALAEGQKKTRYITVSY